MKEINLLIETFLPTHACLVTNKILWRKDIS